MSNPFVNADQVNAVIKVRRGLEVDRLQTIYEDGEIIYSVDKRRVFIGDGVGVAGTYGGNVVGNLNFCSDNYQKNFIEKYDLVYRTDTNGFFLLTGDDYDLPESYVLVGGPLIIPPPPPPYVLSAATRTRRGGVEIREGLKVDNGRVSVDYDEDTMALNGNNQLTLNTNFTARVVNNLPQASYIKYGAAMVNRDTGLRIEDGKLSVAIDDATIKLDPNVDEFRLKVNMGGLTKATKTTAGIMKLGYGLTVDGDTVSVDLDSGSMAFYGNKIGTSSGTGGGGGSTYTPSDASYLAKGIVQITQDTGLKIVDGNLSLSIDNDTLKVKSSPTGTNVLYVDGGGSGGSGGLVGLTKNQFKGTGVATYKLTNFTDNDYDNYIVFVNGVQQVPGDAYTVTTPNITFSDNVPTNADIVVYCATKSTGGGGGSGSDSLPIGTVMYFAVSTAPVGFLECNGSLQDTADYPDLSVMIGNKFLSAGETSVPSGKFRLPDLRSEFIRGWDHGRGVDSGRPFGSNQADEFRTHNHQQRTQGTGGLNQSPAGGGSLGTTLSETSTDSTGGTETRPRNVALLPCIKAETTVSPFVAANFIPKPATPANGQILIFNTSTNSWVASSLPATGSIVAWVNFNGIRNTTNTIDVGLSTSNRLIRASTNVSSVTRNATGEYTINFAAALPDANYAITCNASYGNELAGNAAVFAFPNIDGSSAYVAPTTTSCRILTNTTAGNQDAQNIYVTIVR